MADIENFGEQERQAWVGLYRLFRDVEAQARSHPEDSYWQGKKDGLRSARIFFAEALGLDDEATNLERLRESSPTARSTDLEALQALAKSAMYYISEALWMDEEGERLHPLSRVNWHRWRSWYQQLAERGLVEEVLDTVYD